MKKAFIIILFLAYVVYGVLLGTLYLWSKASELIPDNSFKSSLLNISLLGPALLFAITFTWLFRSSARIHRFYYKATLILFIVAPVWMSAWMCAALDDFSYVLFFKRFLMIFTHSIPLLGSLYLHGYCPSKASGV